MVIYEVDLDGKDSVIRKGSLTAGESLLAGEVEDREVAFLMIERHLLKELKTVISKIREVRQLKRQGY